MSVRFGRPAELLARTAMMVVVASLSGKVVGSLITESAYTYYIRLYPDSTQSPLESTRSGIWAQGYGVLFLVT